MGLFSILRIPDNRWYDKDETINTYVCIKKFINKNGEEFNSLILSEA